MGSPQREAQSRHQKAWDGHVFDCHDIQSAVVDIRSGNAQAEKAPKNRRTDDGEVQQLQAKRTIIRMELAVKRSSPVHGQQPGQCIGQLSKPLAKAGLGGDAGERPVEANCGCMHEKVTTLVMGDKLAHIDCSNLVSHQ